VPETNSASPEANSFALRLKSLATVIAAVTALLVALSGFFKKPEEPAAKASYTELAEAVKNVSESTAKNHDDIVALQAYIDGYLKAQEEEVAATIPSSTPVSTKVASRPRAPKPLPPSMSPRPPIFEPKGF